MVNRPRGRRVHSTNRSNTYHMERRLERGLASVIVFWVKQV